MLKAASEPLRTILLVGIYAGLRVRAEALTLKWENVDLGRKILTTEALYAKNKETETIPLHSKLFEALKTMQAQRQGDYVFACDQSGPPLHWPASVLSCATLHRTP